MAALRRLRRGAIALLLVLPLLSPLSPRAATYSLPHIRHVWVVMLENESESATFGTGGDPVLQALAKKGTYIPNYYGLAHESLPNYLALISGQAPTPQTQGDCQAYQDLTPATPTNDGQVVGQGCVYPASRATIADQLAGAGLTWKGYMEDMGNDSMRDGGTAYPGGGTSCAHPNVGSTDPTQMASGTDQYAMRHNPFVYFHSIIDSPSCAANDVPLSALTHDLQSLSTTPNFAVISPNLCNDGHDVPCKGTDAAGKNTGGLVAIDDWINAYVPVITSSPAFRRDGMLVITFDEGLFTSQNNVQQGDTASCCSEPTGPNTTSPGITGAGGGQVGAVVLSPFATPGGTTSYSYNHYSLLRSIEDLFALNGGDDGHGHLGYAGYDNNGNPLYSFGSDVFTNPAGDSTQQAYPNNTGTRPPPPPAPAPPRGSTPSSTTRAVANASGPGQSSGPSGQPTLDPSALSGGSSPVPLLPGDVGSHPGPGGSLGITTILIILVAGGAVAGGVVGWRRGIFRRLF